MPRLPGGRKRDPRKSPEEMRAVLGLVEYRDGFKAAVLALRRGVRVSGCCQAEKQRSGSDAVLHPDREL